MLNIYCAENTMSEGFMLIFFGFHLKNADIPDKSHMVNLK